MVIDTKLLDELLAGYKKPEDIIGENGLLKHLTKAVLERVLNAALSGHVYVHVHCTVVRGFLRNQGFARRRTAYSHDRRRLATQSGACVIARGRLE